MLPKSPLGYAMRYLDNQRARLQRFVEDGPWRSTTAGSENQPRVVAVRRKNGALLAENFADSA